MPCLDSHLSMRLIIPPVPSAPKARPLSARTTRALIKSSKLIGIPFSWARAQYLAGLKWCHVCAQWQPIQAFYAKTSSWDGLAPRCIICHKMGNPSTGRMCRLVNRAA